MSSFLSWMMCDYIFHNHNLILYWWYDLPVTFLQVCSARCQVTRFRRWEDEVRSCDYWFVSQQPRGVCFRPSPTNTVTPLGQNQTDYPAFCRRWEQIYTSGRGERLILTCWWFHGWHKASEECEHLVIWSKYFLSCVFETQFLFAVVYSAAVS